MRFPDENSFGATPERFTANLVEALHREEKPMKSKRIATVMAVAILILALAATALAVANRAGLMDFFGTRGPEHNPKTYAHKLGADGVLLSETWGDLEITVTEGAGKLDHYALVTTIALKPGVPGVLEAPLRWLVAGEEKAPSALMTTEDGSPVYYVESSIFHINAASDVDGLQLNDDGSISFLSELQVQESADIAQMYCMVNSVKAEAGASAESLETETTFLPFTIPMEETTGARSLAQPTEVPGAAVTMDALYLKQTASGISAHLYYRYDGGAETGYTTPENFLVSLADETGQSLLKPNNQYSGRWIDENMYSAFIPLAVETLPDTVMVQFTNADGKLLGSAALSLDAADSLPSAPAAYERDFIGTYREYPLPGRNRSWDWAYVSAPEGEAIPVYTVPGDPETIRFFVYSGVQGEVFDQYGDWALIYFYGLFSGEIAYVNMARLATEETVRPGILTGTVTKQTETLFAPMEGSTVLHSLEAGEQILLVGEQGSWYYAAVASEDSVEMLGYVAKDAVSVGEETSTLPLQMYLGY